MPRIPDSAQLETQAPRARVSLVADRSGEIIGNTAQQIGQEIQQKRDRFAYSQARSAYLRADIETRASLDNDPDWATQEPRYRATMSKNIDKAAAMITDPNDRAMFQNDVGVDIERGAIAVRGQARVREVDEGRAGGAETLESNRTAALAAQDAGTRWAIINSSKETIAGMRENGYISAQEGEAQWQRWRTDYADGYVDTLPLDEQVSVLSKPGGTPASLLAPDRVAVRLKSALREQEAERRSREIEQRVRLTEARQAMGDRLRDMQTAAALGLPVETPPKSVLTMLYGQQEGEQRFKTAEKLATLSGDVAGLQQLPTAELVAKVDAYRPTEVAGATEQQQMQGALASSVSQIISQRAKDPAGYLAAHSPVVQKAWASFAQDPDQAGQYLSAVRAEKDRLGIPGEQVLPDAYVAGLAADLTDSGSAEKLADRIEAEAARWGPVWPQVYGQLASKLPDTALVIGSGIPKPAATALASMSGLKTAELTNLLPPNVKMADVDGAVNGAFEDFTRSMPAEAARTTGATKDAATRLTLRYLNQGGGSPASAARKAYDDLVGSQYQMRDFRGATLRIPRQLDGDAVEVGARAVLQEFNPLSTAIVVPPGAAMAPEEYQGRYREYVKANGYWVTTPDANGLRLYVDGAPALANKAGDVAWSALVQKGAKAGGAPPSADEGPLWQRGVMER